MLTCFVTGATGHLGYHLVRRLLAQHHQVCALVLPNDPFINTLPKEVTVFIGDLLDERALQTWFTHPSIHRRVLIHAASRITTSEQWDSLTYQVNVESTKKLLRIARDYQIDHFIYVSSVHALKDNNGPALIDETMMAMPNEVKGFYAQSKAEATQHVWQAHLTSEVPVTIVFPSGFIGPHDRGRGYTTQMIEQAMDQRMNIWFQGGYDFVDVRDVADAIVYIAENQIVRERYVLNHEHISIQRLMKSIDDANHRHPWRVWIPRWLIWLAIPWATLYYRLRRLKPLLTPYAYHTLQTKGRFSHRKATQEIAYLPRDLKETMIDVIADLKFVKINR